MATEDISDLIVYIREYVVNQFISTYIPPESIEEQWDVSGLEEGLRNEFVMDLPITKWLAEDDDLHEEPLRARILQEIVNSNAQKEELIGSDMMRRVEKGVMLEVLDSLWKEHLAAMDYLRKGIGLRGYAQKNPKQEYKRESFELFTDLLDRVKFDVIARLSIMQIREEPDLSEFEHHEQPEMEFQHDGVNSLGGADPDVEKTPEQDDKAQPFVRDGQKVGRNQPCPCGSGKKYKQCCGKLS